MHVNVLKDPVAVATEAADEVENFIRTSSVVHLGLSGGSGPPSIHEELTRRDIDWSNVTAWMTDERWVGPYDDASNQRMARRTLVEPTGVRFLAPDTTLDDPSESAARFGALLEEHGFGGEIPSITMLGVGPDGHSASLFPGTDALTVSDRNYVANWVEQLDSWRLTATYPLIATADLILIVATGEGKARMISEVSKGLDVPVAHIRCRGEVRWLIDEAAATEL